MNTIKAEWVRRLRLPHSKQVVGSYRFDGGHCAIGLLIDVMDAWGGPLMLKDIIGNLSAASNISRLVMKEVFDMNDYDGKSFGEIADYLESGDTSVT